MPSLLSASYQVVELAPVRTTERRVRGRADGHRRRDVGRLFQGLAEERPRVVHPGQRLHVSDGRLDARPGVPLRYLRRVGETEGAQFLDQPRGMVVVGSTWYRVNQVT
jgi:hypothetical protein